MYAFLLELPLTLIGFRTESERRVPGRGDGALFPCPAPDCGLQFQRRASFQKHLLRRHGGRGPAPPFSCDSCDKKFIRKIYLTHHRMRYHHETLQRDFVCDVSEREAVGWQRREAGLCLQPCGKNCLVLGMWLLFYHMM